MAEVKKVSGKMQLDTEGGLVRETVVVESGATKAGLGNVEAAGGFTGVIGATKAVLSNGVAAGGSSGEIGFTKAVLGNKEVASGIGFNKAVLGNKEAAGCSTGEIGVTKAGLRNKEAASGSSTKAGLRNKEAAGGSTVEIGVTMAGMANKGTAAGSTGEIGITKAEQREMVWTSIMVTEESWINYVILYKPDQERLAPKQERNAEPTEGLVTKEKVPDSFIGILTRRRPYKKLPPMTDACSGFLSKRAPMLHELYQKDRVRRNCCIDLHCDVLRQHKEKGFAEVGVDFTGGVKMIFVLP